MKIEVVLDVKTTLGEGPLWDVDQQRLYFIDSFDGRVFRCTADGREVRCWDVPEKIGSIAIRKDGNGAMRTCFMQHDNIIGYPDHYVQSTERHPMDFLSEQIKERGWDNVSIGVEMDNYWFSAAAYLSLVNNLPNAGWVDTTALVNWQRAVKSEQELEYMRIAGKFVEIVSSLRPIETRVQNSATLIGIFVSSKLVMVMFSPNIP